MESLLRNSTTYFGRLPPELLTLLPITYKPICGTWDNCRCRQCQRVLLVTDVAPSYDFKMKYHPSDHQLVIENNGNTIKMDANLFPSLDKMVRSKPREVMKEVNAIFVVNGKRDFCGIHFVITATNSDWAGGLKIEITSERYANQKYVILMPCYCMLELVRIELRALLENYLHHCNVM